MKFKHFKMSWEEYSELASDAINKYSRQGLIPLGTRRPFYEYKDYIPEDEIVFMPFPTIEIKGNARPATNVLFLAGSGDGKSLLMKLLWYVVHNAGFYSCYFDLKDIEAGRARKATKITHRLPPEMKADGIKLKNYIPAHRVGEFTYKEKFHISSLRPRHLPELRAWITLEHTPIAAGYIKKIINNSSNPTVEYITKQMIRANQDGKLNSAALASALGKMEIIKDSEFFSTKYKPINLLEDWKKGYSVVISTRGGDDELTCLEVGEKIYRANKMSAAKLIDRPVMFFVDDAGFVLDTDNVSSKNNFAIQQIKNVKYQYRSQMIYDCVAIQSLKIITPQISEGYKYKLISPLFVNVSGLKDIGVPAGAVHLLQTEQLMVDQENHTMEWIFVDGKNYTTFFPFMPPSNHFEPLF